MPFILGNQYLERRIKLYDYTFVTIVKYVKYREHIILFLSPHSHITNIYMVYHTTCDRIHKYLFGTASVICFIVLLYSDYVSNLGISMTMNFVSRHMK